MNGVNFDFLSVSNIKEISRNDKLEDLQDFPPVPSNMVLPDGTMFPVSVCYLKYDKLKEKVKEHRKKRNRDKKKKHNKQEKMEDTADKTEELFLIYNIFSINKNSRKIFKRFIKWSKLKLKNQKKALIFEAECKKEDLIENLNIEFENNLLFLLKENIEHSLESENIVTNLLDDLEVFFKTPEWNLIIKRYLKNPFEDGWFLDNNHFLINKFKEFLLKKYRIKLLSRYKTILSPLNNTIVKNEVVSTVQINLEKALKSHLNQVLAIEHNYIKDLKKATTLKPNNTNPLISTAQFIQNNLPLIH